jgi:Protein of unknown function (DUF1194)
MRLPVFMIGAAASVVLAMASAVQATPVPAVDVELALGVDVSGSVDNNEFALQMQGYVDAFRKSSVQNAILSTEDGRLGKVAAMLYQWSSSGEQFVSAGWSLLDSAASINAFADAIESAGRAFGGSTAVGNAIAFGSSQIATNLYDGIQKVIDISGDGAENDGINTANARDAALASGIDRINGIAIGDVSLLNWYKDNVIGGDKSFALSAANFEDFGTAIEKKLEAEISGGDPDLPGVPVPAAGWMLIAGLGALGAMRRRKMAA